jgi:hypothetical protein
LGRYQARTAQSSRKEGYGLAINERKFEEQGIKYKDDRQIVTGNVVSSHSFHDIENQSCTSGYIMYLAAYMRICMESEQRLASVNVSLIVPTVLWSGSAVRFIN